MPECDADADCLRPDAARCDTTIGMCVGCAEDLNCVSVEELNAVMSKKDSASSADRQAKRSTVGPRAAIRRPSSARRRCVVRVMCASRACPTAIAEPTSRAFR